VKTSLKRMRLLARARAAEAAAVDVHDPEAIEAAAALHLRAAELVDDLDDDGELDELLEEAAGA